MVKLVKTAKIALQRVFILSKQIKGLQANNTKQVKKHNIKVKYITQKETFTVGKGIKLLEYLQDPIQAAASGGSDATLKASTSAIHHCSVCGSPEYNKRTCPALKKTLDNVVII